MSSESVGEIEKDGRVLIIKRIHVTYKLRVAREKQATVERVFAMHADYCPVYRSIKDAIEVTRSLEMLPLE